MDAAGRPRPRARAQGRNGQPGRPRTDGERLRVDFGAQVIRGRRVPGNRGVGRASPAFGLRVADCVRARLLRGGYAGRRGAGRGRAGKPPPRPSRADLRINHGLAGGGRVGARVRGERVACTAGGMGCGGGRRRGWSLARGRRGLAAPPPDVPSRRRRRRCAVLRRAARTALGAAPFFAAACAAVFLRMFVPGVARWQEVRRAARGACTPSPAAGHRP